MNRNSPYFHLKYRVDCKPSYRPVWETIVAFNSDRVALNYAGQCRVFAQGRSEYRVMAWKGRTWVEITEPES